MVDSLFEIASAFRTAIEETIKAGQIREMASFPHGCCSFASGLLQRYLVQQYHIFTWYVSGRFGNGCNGESHAWLETKDCIVIDITGDQYKYKKLKFTESVYVGSREDGFHNRFELDEPIAYSRLNVSFDQNLKFDKRYEAVIRHLR